MVSVPIDIHYIDEKIEWNWRSEYSSEYHILCNTEKSHQVWNDIECEYMTTFSYLGGLLL